MDIIGSMPIWSATAIAAAGTLTSPTIDTFLMNRLESVLVQFTSVAGAATVKLEYAISDDDVTYGSYDDETDIIADSNVDFATNKEGLHRVSMPAVGSRYFRLRVTELGGVLADTLVTLTLLFRDKVE